VILDVKPIPPSPSPVDAASLVRATVEAKWRKYDEPAYLRITPRSIEAEIFGSLKA